MTKQDFIKSDISDITSAKVKAEMDCYHRHQLDIDIPTSTEGDEFNETEYNICER